LRLVTGLALGRRDGALETGFLVGFMLRRKDGFLLVFTVGLLVGLSVGFLRVRCEIDGIREGLPVGFLGFLLGIFVGLTGVGFDDGFIVGRVDPQFPMVLYSVFDMFWNLECFARVPICK